MAVLGLKKLILKNELNTSSIEFFLLRFYEQIITGTWSFLFLLPIENVLRYIVDGSQNSEYLSFRYFVIFIIYSCIFLFSAVLIPGIRELRLKRLLHKITFGRGIEGAHRERLKAIVSKNLLCRNLFTFDGFLQFVSNVLSNTMFLVAYFVCDFIIDIIVTGNISKLYLPAFFMIIFILLTILSWYMDRYVSTVLRKKDNGYFIEKMKSYGHKFFYDKELMIEAMQLVLKDSFENKTGRILVENIINDIYESAYTLSSDIKK